MQGQEESNNLRFGDKIVIKGNIDRAGSEYGGFLCAKGFVSTAIQFQVIPSEILSKASENESRLGFLKNQRDMVFQIWPRLNFQAHKEQRQSMKRIDRTKKNIEKLERATKNKKNPSGAEENQKVVLKDKKEENEQTNTQMAEYQAELEKYEISAAIIDEKVAREKANNFKSLSQYIGQPVGYGAEIQIMHLDSKLFLSSQTLASDSEKSAYRFLLSGDCSSGMLFRILPKFKLRNIGDTIQYRDQIIIQNLKLSFSVAFSEDQAIKGKVPEEKPSASSTRSVEPKTIDTVSYVVDTYISQYTEVAWEFRKFVTSTSESAKSGLVISGGDLVRFLHRETGGYLSADIPYKNTQNQPEVFLRTYNGTFLDESQSVSSIWEVEQVHDYNKGATCLIGSLSDPILFQLRHLQTGRLLSQLDGQFVLGSGMEERKVSSDPNSLVAFTSTKSEENAAIEHMQCYQLSIQKKYISLSSLADDVFKSAVLPPMQGYFTQIEDSELNLTRSKVVAVSEQNDENALQIERISEEEKDNALLLLSAQPILLKMISIFKLTIPKENLNNDLMKKVGSTLEQLIHFVCKLEPDDDLLDCQGFSIQKNQQMMRDIGFINILTSMLYYPFKNKFFDPKDLSQLPKDLLYVFQLSYVLIKLVIREYRPNELFASQWLSLFMEQAMEYDKDVDILAEPTLTELIDNNETILRKKIDSSIIQRFVNLLISEKSVKYIKLLRALINCDGKAMKLNQELIVDLLLVNNPGKLEFINPLVLQSNGQIQISISDVPYEMDRLKDNDTPEVVEYLEYYVNLIYLLSDLCMDKQFVAIEQLEGYFSYEICFNIISNSNNSFEIRSAFACLILTCHIEGQRMQKIQAPNYLKVWNDVWSPSAEIIKRKQQSQNQIESRKSASGQQYHVPVFSENPEIIRCETYYPEQFDRLKDFINAYMMNITQKNTYNRVWETSVNEFTLNIIQLCKSLFEYGLYTKIENFTQILKPLISYLNASRDVSSESEEKNKRLGGTSVSRNVRSTESEFNLQQGGDDKQKTLIEDRFAETEENQILSRCRTHICEILSLVDNIILNWMGDKILIQFKKYYEEKDLASLNLLEIVQKVRQRILYLNRREEILNEEDSKSKKADLLELEQSQPEDIFGLPFNWVEERIESTEFSIDSIVAQKRQSQSANGTISQKDKILNLFLIDLLQYENSGLVKASLQILEANYSKRRNLLEYLKEIQIIDDDKKYAILHKAKRSYNQLKILVDETENWYALDNQKSSANTQTVLNILDEFLSSMTDFRIEKSFDIESELSEINRKNKMDIGGEDDEEDDGLGGKEQQKLMGNKQKQKNKLDFADHQRNNDDEDDKDEEVIQEKLRHMHSEQNSQVLDLNSNYFNVYALRQNVRSEVQKMFRLLNIHTPILELLLTDLQHNSKQSKSSRSQILIKCFKVLAIFCFENSHNQRSIFPSLECLLDHLKIDDNNLSQILINELVRENEELLYDAPVVHKIIGAFSEIINQQELNNPNRAMFLDYLCTFMKTKRRVIRPNQVELILTLSNPRYKKVLFFLQPGSKEHGNFVQNVQALTSSISNPTSGSVTIGSELQYFLQQLELFSIACEERNDVTESKSQNFFPLTTISKLLEDSEKCWPVRKSLMTFYFHVFLETEKDIDDMPNMIKIMKFVQNDLEFLANNIEQFKQANMTVETFSGKNKLSMLINEYIYGVLLFCVKECSNHNLIQGKKETFTFYRSILDSLVKLEKSLSQDNEESKLFIAQIFFLISKKQFPKQIADMNAIQLTFSSKTQQLIKQYEEQKIDYEKFNQANTAEIQRLGQQKSVSQKFHIIFDKFSTTQEFIDKDDEEFVCLTQTIKEIQPLTNKAFKGLNTISFENLCTRFCSIINPQNDKLSEQQFIMGLRIFRKFIEAENKDNQDPAAEWEDESDEACLQVKHKQDVLSGFGVMQVVCNFLKSDHSRDIKNEVVLLGIAMLYGGNTNCQGSLYECLQNDQSNSVMACLFEMIEYLSSKIKKSMSRRNAKNVEKFRQHIDDMQKIRRAQTQGEEKLKQLEDQKAEQQAKKKIMKEEREKQNLIEQIYSTANIYDEEEMIRDLKRVYRFLQLFCEGHFLPMQNYLREQRQNSILNPKSINFIKSISQNFGSYIRYMNDMTIGLGQQMIDLLVESVQGPCQLNQKCISDNKIVDHTKELLSSFQQSSDYEKRGIDTDDRKEEVNQVVSKSTLLLVSLLEGNFEKDIPLYIDQQLDYSFIKAFLANQYKMYVTETLEMKIEDSSVKEVIETASEVQQTFTGQINEAFNMFILILTINDQLKRTNPQVESEAGKCLEQKTDHLEDSAIDFFNQNTCSIEVFFQEKIARVFFIQQPACRNISKNSRKAFMNEVDRGTLNDKLGSLVAISGTFVTEMDHMTRLKGWPLHFTSNRFQNLKSFSTFLSFLINIVMVAVLDRTVQNNNSRQNDSPDDIIGISADTLINVLGLIQLIINLIMMVFWLVLNVPVILTQKWQDFVDGNQYLVDAKKEERLESDGHPKYFSTELITYALKTKGPSYHLFLDGERLRLGSLWGYIKYYETSFMLLMNDGSFLYLIFYIGCSVLGFFFDSLIYSFQLLDIINQFPTLRNVTLAVERNVNQLLKTFLLGIIVIFIYSVLGYTFVVEDYYFADSGDGGENLCSDLMQCFLQSINLGLRNGGGVGDSMHLVSFASDNRGKFIFRVIFDVTFFALINVIFINIIFGIIIDTFAELRDQKSEVVEDMKNICFICGLDRYVFDKNADGFENHIERDHTLWNYIFYMYFLQKKEATDYNGIETEVVAKIEKSDLSWFPMMKAISIGEQENQDDLADKVVENLELVSGQFKELQDKINNLHNQQKKDQLKSKQLAKAAAAR